MGNRPAYMLKLLHCCDGFCVCLILLIFYTRIVGREVRGTVIDCVSMTQPLAARAANSLERTPVCVGADVSELVCCRQGHHRITDDVTRQPCARNHAVAHTARGIATVSLCLVFDRSMEIGGRTG